MQWAVASLFVLFVGMSMAELASAAPTSGGVSDSPLSRPRHLLLIQDDAL